MLKLLNYLIEIVEAIAIIQILDCEGRHLWVHGYDFMIST